MAMASTSNRPITPTYKGDITNISPKVSGYIVKSYVINQSVKEGDLLVQIDDRDYQAALAQACALYPWKLCNRRKELNRSTDVTT